MTNSLCLLALCGEKIMVEYERLWLDFEISLCSVCLVKLISCLALSMLPSIQSCLRGLSLLPHSNLR